MTHRPISRFLVLLAVCSLAACHGGGKSVVPKPTATPTLAPGCKVLTPQSGGSTYTLTSNPTGLAVQRRNATDNTCVYFSGTTQTSDAPQTAPNQWQYVFTPTATSPYTVPVVQTLNGNHTIFYNQAGDSSGAITVSSLQSVARRTGSSLQRGAETSRGIQRFTGAGVVADQLLVRYRSAGTTAQTRARASQIELAEGATAGPELTTVSGAYERFVRIPAGTDATAFAATLRSQRDVLDVYPVHKRFALGRPAMAVSDPHANNVDQWYLFADGFPNAWSYTHGTGIKIAVIDTGVDRHNTDLTQNLIFQTGYESANHDAQDTNGHGTNVTGIAAAITNNALGFAGGGYNVSLLAYNVFPDATSTSHNQNATVADEVAAVNDAVGKGVDVINLSLGAAEDYSPNNGFDQGEHDSIEAAITAGVTVVAAAGNDADGGESGTPHSVLDYPAAYDGVIAVGASALRDNNTGVFAGSTEYVAPYSQFGPGLALVAPGGDPGGSDTSPLHWIWNYSTSTAALPADQCTYGHGTLPVTPTNCSAFFAGTSQATPQVSAAAALLLAAAGGHHTLTPAKIAQILEDTADNINDPHQGHGRLNIYRAVAAVSNDTGAYSGPTVQKTSPTQIVAFAYDNSGATIPHILDVNYPGGVPVDATGNFRLGDVPASATVYHVGVWYDANGDGIVNAGDQFGNATSTCSAAQHCTIGNISMHAVTAGFVLP
ncbi:MAG TPA: S8 family serine peptidase [Xanthomonadales bacterium]|nr:S8 family serine peptidase [Xanthomonadales bacterium]